MFILGNSGIVITFIVNVTIFIQTKITMAQFLLLIFMVFFFSSLLCGNMEYTYLNINTYYRATLWMWIT